MLVSRWVLQAYSDLAGESTANYYLTEGARPAVGSSYGQYTAIYKGSEVVTDVSLVPWDAAVWRVDQWNGENWSTVTLDTNFSLVVTNSGIEALTDAVKGQYKLEISRIVVKQTPIATGTNLMQMTDSMFTSNYRDICLDTDNKTNTTFTLENNLTHRTNTLNGGLQFTVELGLDCLGQDQASKGSVAPRLTEFNVAAIALYVVKQSNPAENVLFAVASLPAVVQKTATTPTTIGNSLKFYLNTTLSNMGAVTNVTNVQDSVNSIPEVVAESDLINTYDGVKAPYNLYLIDDFNGTNIPALAVRRGGAAIYENPIQWTYFTPTDDSIQISSDLVDDTLLDFMVAAWNPTTQKYVPADPDDSNLQLAGLFNKNYLIYAGTVNNFNATYFYDLTTNNAGSGYHAGEVLSCSSNGITFMITIISVDEIGKPKEVYYTPHTGNTNITITDSQPTYVSGSGGSGLLISVNSYSRPDRYIWNFSASDLNKPLYVDPNNPGKMTTTPSNTFVGWCTGTNSIRLGLDLRNEATETTYGTTRYATNTEIKNADSNAGMITSVQPNTLYNNYLKKEVSDTGDKAGDSRLNPQIINTYTQFTKSIECTGTDLNGVAFKGTAYRALWEDLAEYYRSDRVYPAGTLICIGCGINEITKAETECNGIISTNPGYQLGEKKDELDLPVALVGKVPVIFAEDCVPEFGDRVYLSKTEPGKASTIPYGKCLGKVIDKNKDLDQRHTVLCSVRIDF